MEPLTEVHDVEPVRARAVANHKLCEAGNGLIACGLVPLDTVYGAIAGRHLRQQLESDGQG